PWIAPVAVALAWPVLVYCRFCAIRMAEVPAQSYTLRQAIVNTNVGAAVLMLLLAAYALVGPLVNLAVMLIGAFSEMLADPALLAAVRPRIQQMLRENPTMSMPEVWAQLPELSSRFSPSAMFAKYSLPVPAMLAISVSLMGIAATVMFYFTQHLYQLRS